MAIVPATAPERAELIERVLRTLNGAVGHARLYGPHHRETRRSSAVFAEELADVLGVLGAIRLTATVDGLMWDRFTVTRESDEQRGIGRFLHAEGISSLTFLAGLSPTEVHRLVSVLRINMTLPQHQEDSLELLLWQQDFKRIEFTAFASLMEAEALSGRAGSANVQAAQAEIERMLDAQMEQQLMGDRNLRAMIREEDLVRAIDAAQARLYGELRDELDQDDWDTVFEVVEDTETIAAMVGEQANEQHDDLLARVARVLFVTAIGVREELPPSKALELAREALDKAYTDHLSRGVALVLDTVRRIMTQMARGGGGPALTAMQEFYRDALPASRLVPLLLSIDSKQNQSVLRFLVKLMPVETILSVLEITHRDHRTQNIDGVLRVIGEVAGTRLRPMMETVAELPLDRAVPLVRIFALRDAADDHALRRELLRSSIGAIRLEALRWYGESDAPTDLDAIVSAVMDPQPGVRRAARDVLAKFRPRRAEERLKAILGSERFEGLDLERKKDVARAYGAIGRNRAVPALTALFQTKLPMFGGGGTKLELVEAGACGLKAVGSPQAMEVLRKAASGLVGARRHVAERVLSGGTR